MNNQTVKLTDNTSLSSGVVRLFYASAASLIFIIITINLYYKTPHGIMSIYSIDRIFFGLSALYFDRLLYFIMVFFGYWAIVMAYTLFALYIFKLDVRKWILFAMLMGIYVHVNLSLFDLAANNTHWSLSFNTYYDPLFIYLLLGIYVLVLLGMNIIISRRVIFSIIKYLKHREIVSRDLFTSILLLPVVMLTGYSFFLLRFNKIILVTIVIVMIAGLLASLFNIFPGALIRGKVLWVRVRRVSLDEKTFLILVSLFTLFIRIAFAIANKDGMGPDDSILYANLGRRFASGENVQDIFFPPGYWVYLGIFYKIFGYNNLLLMILQSFIGITIPLLTYLIAKEIFNPGTGRLSAILVSINSNIILHSTVIATEAIYTPLTLLALWLLLKVRKSPNVLIFISIGLLLGISIVIKTVMLAFPVVILGWLFLIYKNKNKMRTFLISSFLIIIMVCISIAPVTYRNYLNHNRFILLTEFRQVKDTLINPYLEHAGVYGDSYREILNNIVADPVRSSIAFVKGAPLQLMDLFWGKKMQIPFDLFYIHNGSPYAFNLKFYLTLLTISGIVIAFLVERHLWKERLLLILLITYYCLMYIFFYGKSRYAMPMLPLIIMFGAYGFAYLLGKLKEGSHLINLYRDDIRQQTAKQSSTIFMGGIVVIIFLLFGLNYFYNNKAEGLLKSGRNMLETGNYAEAKEVIHGVIREYPHSLSSQNAYHDLIISGAQNLDLTMNILGEYFLYYKGLPYTIETFEELITVFRRTDQSFFERMQTSSDMKRFVRMLDFQEAAIRNIANNYPITEHVTERTVEILYYVHTMRIKAKLRLAETFLKERMPDLAEREFQDIKDMIYKPERRVFRQWFLSYKLKSVGDTSVHKMIGILYSKHGFNGHALREFETYLKDYPGDADVKRYAAEYKK